MLAREIRKAHFDYMAEMGHSLVPRAPLVPRDGHGTLITASGVQSLVPYLLGTEHPLGSRIANSQPCLRLQDVDEVGDNRHTTFFEMLGNWSFGDYYKEGQIRQFWTFLTDRIGLDPRRLYVSCFAGDPRNGIPRDEESAGIWADLFRSVGVAAGTVVVGSNDRASQVGTTGARIAFYSRENWWCRCGTIEDMPEGEPGGANTEVFYLFPSVRHDLSYGLHCHPNCDCGRFIELGNSVFMEYIRTGSGFELLPRRSVDCGAGLARIAAASSDTSDIFHTDLLWPAIERLQSLSGRPYEGHTTDMRIIVDHLGGAAFLVADGVSPSGKAQGYVLRHLVRRALRFAYRLGLRGNFLPDLLPSILDVYEEPYPDVAQCADDVFKVLIREGEAFRATLRRGLRRLETGRQASMTGADLFALHDTYGLPVDVSCEEAFGRGISLTHGWREEFDGLMAQQRARSRTAATMRVGGRNAAGQVKTPEPRRARHEPGGRNAER